MTESAAYEQRLAHVFAEVRAAGVNGVSVKELKGRVGGDSRELTAKLTELRRRDCVLLRWPGLAALDRVT